MSRPFHLADDGTPCRECEDGGFQRWHFECHRGDLEDQIIDLALGTGEWFLHDDAGSTRYRVGIAYDAKSAKSIFRDFRHVSGRFTALSQPEIPLLDFLKQFEDLEIRWENHYDPITREVIGKCAQFQAAVINRQSSLPEDLPDDQILIALSLRCLVLTHEIQDIDMSVPFDNFYMFKGEETVYHPDGISDGRPSIEVVKLSGSQPCSSDKPELDSEERISSLLENLVQTTQRLIMRNDPQSWPLLLCTLCISQKMKSDWNPNSELMETTLVPSFQAINSAYGALCHWFHICAKNMQPFTDNWDKEAYSQRVNWDPLLVGLFQWMNDLWLEGSAEYVGGVPEDVFMHKRISWFTGAFALGWDEY